MLVAVDHFVSFILVVLEDVFLIADLVVGTHAIPNIVLVIKDHFVVVSVHSVDVHVNHIMFMPFFVIVMDDFNDTDAVVVV